MNHTPDRLSPLRDLLRSYGLTLRNFATIPNPNTNTYATRISFSESPVNPHRLSIVAPWKADPEDVGLLAQAELQLMASGYSKKEKTE